MPCLPRCTRGRTARPPEPWILRRALGEYGMTPTDLLDALPAALREGEDSPPA